MKSIGVLGGTFNPVHLGHLAIADEAMARLGLAEVLFLPAGRPWMKAGEAVAAAEHRVGMLRLAIAGRLSFSVSTLEIERPGFTYTVETMACLRDFIGSEVEIYFILSWGTLAQLPEWREPGRLLEMCRLVVVPRPGCPRPDLGQLEAAVPGLSRRVTMLEGPLVDISATEIRQRVARGEDISRLVPPAVTRYIKKHGLYRREAGW